MGVHFGSCLAKSPVVSRGVLSLVIFGLDFVALSLCSVRRGLLRLNT